MAVKQFCLEIEFYTESQTVLEIQNIQFKLRAFVSKQQMKL